MTRSVLPALRESLERYLDECASIWLAQPENNRMPTLPTTSDGKVNVRAITLALGRPRSQEQHFFKKPELAAAINAVAVEQGLKPVGARNQPEDMEKAVAARLRRVEGRSNELSKLVAEQASVIESQRRTIESMREQIRMFEETGQVLRTAPVLP